MSVKTGVGWGVGFFLCLALYNACDGPKEVEPEYPQNPEAQVAQSVQPTPTTPTVTVTAPAPTVTVTPKPPGSCMEAAQIASQLIVHVDKYEKYAGKSHGQILEAHEALVSHNYNDLNVALGKMANGSTNSDETIQTIVDLQPRLDTALKKCESESE